MNTATELRNASNRRIRSPSFTRMAVRSNTCCPHLDTDKRPLFPDPFLCEDQQYIRQCLTERKLCAFIADGSVLPRESGVSERPMKNGVPFRSPESLRITLDLPNKGAVSGMGIPQIRLLPLSSASIRLAAWDVLPLASSVEKCTVSSGIAADHAGSA